MGSKEKAGGNAPTISSVTPAEKALVRDLKLAAAPDVNKPFVDAKDACSRSVTWLLIFRASVWAS